MSDSRVPLWRRPAVAFAAVAGVVAVLVFLVTGLLTSIFQRKQEARNQYVRLVEVREETTDPAAWGVNWSREYDDYLRTAEVTRTRFGGSEAMPDEKAKASPWLTRMFAGYAFAIDYRDRRGHAYMLQDQEATRRVTELKQPGSCLQCHTSVIPTYRRLGGGDVFKGFEALGKRRTEKRMPRS
jgi:nitrite reductase (cytochrome c-552)